MVDPKIRRQVSACIDAVSNIVIKKFRRSDAVRFFGNHTSLSLSGYLVFTGEPHLVIFSDSGFDIPDMANQIFISSSVDSSIDSSTDSSMDSSLPVLEKRKASSQAFVDFIGKYFVREFSNYFPVGININFVRISPDGKSFAHRCFERGINHETLACGTGSLASAFIARELGKVKTKKMIVFPHCCRWFLPDAEIRVEQLKKGWRIKGSPARLFNGNFCWERWFTRYNTKRRTAFTKNSTEGKSAAIAGLYR
jgi:diaminopimelate epimerase